MGPRPAAAATAATPAVRTVPQYKYAAGVRNPQQHLNTQPQVAMQQVCDPGNCSVLLLMSFAQEGGERDGRAIQALYHGSRVKALGS